MRTFVLLALLALLAFAATASATEESSVDFAEAEASDAVELMEVAAASGTIQIKHVHTSSRYTKSKSNLVRALKKYVKEAELITITEVAEPDRAAGTKSIPGWGVAAVPGNHGSAESVVMFDESVFTLEKKDAYLLGHSEKMGKAYVWATTALLTHTASGARILVSVAHLPSSVESCYQKQSCAAARVHKSGVKKWAKYIAQKKREWNSHGDMMCADVNLDLKKPWIAKYSHSWLPGYKPTWLGNMPKSGGTFGNRLIDWAVTDSFQASKQRIFPRDSSSDHNAWAQTLTLTGDFTGVAPAPDNDDGQASGKGKNKNKKNKKKAKKAKKSKKTKKPAKKGKKPAKKAKKGRKRQ